MATVINRTNTMNHNQPNHHHHHGTTTMKDSNMLQKGVHWKDSKRSSNNSTISHPNQTSPNPKKTLTIRMNKDKENMCSSSRDEKMNAGTEDSSPTKRLAVYNELVSYVESIPIVSKSLNSILQAEYNDPEKAFELMQYYCDKQSHKKLLNYTVSCASENDIHYKIISLSSSSGNTKKNTIEDPMEISYLFKRLLLNQDTKKKSKMYFKKQQEPTTLDMLSRCCNHTILYDIIKLIIGSDLLIRPQYLTNYSITNTSHTIHYDDDDDPSLCFVDCSCQLNILFPTTAKRVAEQTNTTANITMIKDIPHYTISKLNMHIRFFPHLPDIEFRIDPVPNDSTSNTMDSWLQSTATFLVAHSNKEEGGFTSKTNTTTNNCKIVHDCREAFLLNYFLNHYPNSTLSKQQQNPDATQSRNNKRNQFYKYYWDIKEMRFILGLICLNHYLIISNTAASIVRQQQKQNEE